MKVIIAGSRTIVNKEIVFNIIENSKFNITEIVSGTAQGIDSLGEQFAIKNNIKISKFIPSWKDLGKIAGIIRNKEMAQYADSLIAIWDGESKGTRHMIEYMSKIKKPVEVHILKKREKTIK